VEPAVTAISFLTTRSGEVAAVLMPHGGAVTAHRPLGPEPRPAATRQSLDLLNPGALIVEPTSPVPPPRRRGLATHSRPSDEVGGPRRRQLPLVNPMFLSLFATVLLLVGLLVVVLLHPAGP
jgi:hypothetical protein